MQIDVGYDAAFSSFCGRTDAVAAGDLRGRRAKSVSAVLQIALGGDRRPAGLSAMRLLWVLLRQDSPSFQMRRLPSSVQRTSGTIFAAHKLSFVDLLGAICLFVNASNGMSSVQLSRDLDVQYKTAFVRMRKLREAMARETAETRLSGDVEIDGAYFGGHVRQANLRTDRVDRRLLKNRSGKRRVVVVLRQRGGRTLTRAFLREAEGVDFAKERVEPGSALSADELPHWDLLADPFDVHRVNHSEAYSEGGVHTNLAESYFSRFRRMIRGQHHAVSGNYLGAYAGHAAWLEDHSNESNGVIADRLILGALAAPVSGTWAGYLQRRAA